MSYFGATIAAQTSSLVADPTPLPSLPVSVTTVTVFTPTPVVFPTETGLASSESPRQTVIIGAIVGMGGFFLTVVAVVIFVRRKRKRRVRTSIREPFLPDTEEPRLPPAIKQYRAISTAATSDRREQLAAVSEIPAYRPLGSDVPARQNAPRDDVDAASFRTFMEWLYTAPLGFLVEALNHRLQETDLDEQSQRPPTYTSRIRRLYSRRQASGRGRTGQVVVAARFGTGGESLQAVEQGESIGHSAVHWELPQ